MVRYEVFFHGLIVGAVSGKTILDAYSKARKHFPDATSVNRYLGHPDLVWIGKSKEFALLNFDHILA